MHGGRLRGVAIVAVALLATACGGDDGDATESAASPATASTAAGGSTAADAFTLEPGPDGCDHREPPRPEVRESYDAPPSVPLDPAKAYRIVMQTSCGTITVAVDQKLGGPVADAVAALARDGFYDGLSFHRVVPRFVLQGGDPTGEGTGGPGFTVTQPPPTDYVYKVGDLAMAKTADEPAGASGSQFFLTSTAEGAEGLLQPGSPPLYAVVGHATDAMSMTTIGRIDALAQGDGPPSQPVWIVRATLEEG